MRIALLLPAAALMAACADSSHITATEDSPSAPEGTANNSSGPMPSVDELTYATGDALDRLMVGLEPDAAKRLRAPIQSMAIALQMNTIESDPSTLYKSYRNVVDALNGLRDQSRADATTVFTMAMEFGVAR